MISCVVIVYLNCSLPLEVNILAELYEVKVINLLYTLLLFQNGLYMVSKWPPTHLFRFKISVLPFQLKASWQFIYFNSHVTFQWPKQAKPVVAQVYNIFTYNYDNKTRI